MTASTAVALTARDRCDRCGAPAAIRAELSGFGELLFCPHHARVHASRLKEVASHIHDESGALEML